MSKKCLKLLISMSNFIKDMWVKYRQKLGFVLTGFVGDFNPLNSTQASSHRQHIVHQIFTILYIFF